MLPAIPVALKREWDVNILKLQALDARAVSPAELHAGDSVMGFYGEDPRDIRFFCGGSFTDSPREESPREESPERRSQRRGRETVPWAFHG